MSEFNRTSIQCQEAMHFADLSWSKVKCAEKDQSCL
jgi:hypothetical protein